MPPINVEKLQAEATKYDRVLRTLPFIGLEGISALGINLIDCTGKHTIVNNHRRGGILGGYHPDDVKYNKELMKVVPMTLEPKNVYAAVKDNVTNYDNEQLLLVVGGRQTSDPISKNHPLERQILESIVTSFGEDAALSLFAAERNTAIKSPLTAFDGIYATKSKLIAAGFISTEQKNLITTGVFPDPADDVDTRAFDMFVDFLKQMNTLLKMRKTFLHCAESLFDKVVRAYENKMKGRIIGDITSDMVWRAVKEKARTSNIELKIDPIFGTGDMLQVIVPGFVDFGLDTKSANKFVEVMKSTTDPNEITFWIQSGMGVRFRDVHAKVFLTNEQENSAADLFGDYTVADAAPAA